MDSFLGCINFQEEAMEELKILFEEREERWVEKVVDLDAINKIWLEIIGKELYQSVADLANELLNHYGDNRIKMFSLNTKEVVPVITPENTKEVVPIIITEKEGDFSAEVTKESVNKIYGDKEDVLEDRVSLYADRFRMVGNIGIIRHVLYSKELLADILINIYYSIYFHCRKEKFCELYTSDLDFPERWKQYCKKGRASASQAKGGSKCEKCVEEERDFVEVTGNKIPITCKIKSRSNQGPLIQDVVPNIFRMFVMEKNFVNKYYVGKPEKYKDVENAYTKYSYSISEQYILEEILGVHLSKSIYHAFQGMFSQLSFNAVKKGGEEGMLELLIRKLLCWKGQNSRVLFVQGFLGVLKGGTQGKVRSYEWVYAKEDFVKEMLGICIQWTDILIEKGNVFYEVLYREMLYVLWRQAAGSLEMIERRCEEYLKENNFLPANTIQEFGNKGSIGEERVEEQMYCWIQKYVLSEIEKRAEARGI